MFTVSKDGTAGISMVEFVYQGVCVCVCLTWLFWSIGLDPKTLSRVGPLCAGYTFGSNESKGS